VGLGLQAEAVELARRAIDTALDYIDGLEE
jgi:hypothetical protein